MTKQTWIIFAAIVVVLFGGLIFFSNKNQIDVSNVNLRDILPATNQSGDIADHVSGNTKSKVVLVEYGDYQCPYCGQAYPTIKALTDKYKDQLAFVFRNYPITNLHPNAKAAAAAAEAAGLQGKYWEMHDKLYTSQNEWSDLSTSDRTEAFASYARGLGLDVDKFKSDMGSDAVNQKINFDLALGKKAKVSGTPTYVLDGKTVDEYVLDGKIVPSGTKGADLIWGHQDLFDKLIIQPELKKYNIALPKE